MGRLGRLAWLPVPVFAVTMAVLSAADQRTPYESVYLLILLNFVFSVLASGLIVYLVSRSFLASGKLGLLMLGCGVMVWGLAGFVGVTSGIVGTASRLDINAFITIHNVCVWVSALCHLIGALFFLRRSPSVRAAGLWLAIAYTTAVGAVGMVTAAALAGWLPTFFIQGQGGTPVRDFVLGSAVVMFALTAALLAMASRKPMSAFVYWYTLALALIAVGLFGIMIETVHANVLSWAGRSAQFLSGVYMLIAAIASMRESGSWSIPLEEALRESEERYRSLVKHAPAAIYEMDVQGTRFLSVNEVMCDILGYTRDELFSMKPADLLDTESRLLFRDRIGRKLAGEQIDENVEYRIRRKDGEWIYVVVNVGTLSYTDEHPTRISVIAHDVTERKRAEEALRSGEATLRGILDAARESIWRFSPDGIILACNETAARRLGKSAPELVGRSFFDVLPEDLARSRMERLREVVESGGPVEFEDQRAGILFHHSFYPIRDDEGRVTSIACFSRDITERKQAEEALAQAHADAERRAAEMESFISNMTEGVVLHDADGNAVLANDAAIEILGADPLTSVEERVEQFEVRALDGTRMKPEETASGRALRGETVRDLCYRVTAPGDKDKIIAVSSSPVRAPGGTLLGATTVFRDVTDRHELERQKDELLQREHHIAQVLQQAIIPPEIPSEMLGYRIAVKYRPALREAEIGGDFYDVFELGYNRIGVLIGDVAGKGLTAAIRVAAARHAIRSYAYIDPRPARVLQLANEALCRDSEDSLILTAFFAILDTDLGGMVYSNAGHEPPVLACSAGRCMELECGGVPLGLVPGMEFEQSSRRLDPGDVVVMVTDGITEARSPGPVLYGKERLVEFVKQHMESSPQDIASGVLQAAMDHAGGDLQDDAAVVVFTPREMDGS